MTCNGKRRGTLYKGLGNLPCHRTGSSLLRQYPQTDHDLESRPRILAFGTPGEVCQSCFRMIYLADARLSHTSSNHLGVLNHLTQAEVALGASRRPRSNNVKS